MYGTRLDGSGRLQHPHAKGRLFSSRSPSRGCGKAADLDTDDFAQQAVAQKLVADLDRRRPWLRKQTLHTNASLIQNGRRLGVATATASSAQAQINQRREYIGQRKLFQQLVFLGPPSSHSLLDLPQRSLTQLLLQVPLLPRYLIEGKAVLLQARMGWSL